MSKEEKKVLINSWKGKNFAGGAYIDLSDGDHIEACIERFLRAKADTILIRVVDRA